MPIATLDEMKSYIKRRLGAGITVVPITDEQLDDVISDCSDILNKYSYGSDSTYLDYIAIDLLSGQDEYNLSGNDIQEIFDLEYSVGNSSTQGLSNMFSPINAAFYDDWVVMGNHPGSAGPGGLTLTHYQISMNYVKEIQRYFTRDYTARWHRPTETIKVFPAPNEDITALLSVYKRSTTAQLYNNMLFKDLCVAKAMIQWSINVGKYEATTPGGGRINYERFENMGMKLEEETMMKIRGESEPVDFFIG